MRPAELGELLREQSAETVPDQHRRCIERVENTQGVLEIVLEGQTLGPVRPESRAPTPRRRDRQVASTGKPGKPVPERVVVGERPVQQHDGGFAGLRHRSALEGGQSCPSALHVGHALGHGHIVNLLAYFVNRLAYLT